MEVRGEVTASWWLIAAALITLVAWTIAGNAAVVGAIRRASPRFSTHYPLASLAVADLMLGVCVLPISAFRELYVFQPHPAICSFWNTMDVLCCTASILSLCVLGWERWCGIVSPLDRGKRSRRARVYAGLVWPVAGAVALPTAFVPFHVHRLAGEAVKACTVNTNIGYVFYSMTLSFYLPVCGMVVMYSKILLALAHTPPLSAHRPRPPSSPAVVSKKQPLLNLSHTPVPPRKHKLSEDVNAAGNCDDTNEMSPIVGDVEKNTPKILVSPKGCHLNPPQSDTQNLPSPLKVAGSPGGIIPRQRRATQTIMTLMSVFLICWSPFFVMLPIDSLCECVPDSLWLVCTWLGYANSAIDPLIYAAASPTVRKALVTSFRSQEAPMTLQARRKI